MQQCQLSTVFSLVSSRVSGHFKAFCDFTGKTRIQQRQFLDDCEIYSRNESINTTLISTVVKRCRLFHFLIDRGLKNLATCWCFWPCDKTKKWPDSNVPFCRRCCSSGSPTYSILQWNPTVALKNCISHSLKISKDELCDNVPLLCKYQSNTQLSCVKRNKN